MIGALVLGGVLLVIVAIAIYCGRGKPNDHNTTGGSNGQMGGW
jgi:hypothetical protein